MNFRGWLCLVSLPKDHTAVHLRGDNRSVARGRELQWGISKLRPARCDRLEARPNRSGMAPGRADPGPKPGERFGREVGADGEERESEQGQVFADNHPSHQSECSHCSVREAPAQNGPDLLRVTLFHLNTKQTKQAPTTS